MARPVIRAKVSNLPEIQAAFAAQPEKVRLGVIDALKVIGLLVLNRAKSRLQGGSKTGRRYKRGAVTHQASAPGESPATDTGKLVSSGEWSVDEANLWVTISFTAFYARLLEFGTRFILPRPFILPALDQVKEQIPAIFEKAIRARLKGGGDGE
ncbi:MAG: HK97-gp10 family putative phage morphogenesis protein [Ahrensia sp.]|nr:HK97-gp10 family putative phage morphogenesis protein [Ahrensia sp.]